MRVLTRHFPTSRRARAALALAVAALVTAVALSLGGCGSEPRPKVVIIGIDGMDWALADPLLEEGKMPNLARVLDEGMRAELHSLLPLQKSPTIWTTIATGKGPSKHGIGDFVQGDASSSLYNSRGWKARAIWDILGEKGYTVGIVNWLLSWPAQEVNGYYVSDRMVYAPEDGYQEAPYLTYPEELEAELAPLRLAYAGTTIDDIADLMNGDRWRAGDDAADFAWAGVQTIRTIHAQDQTVLNFAKHLLDTREQPDFYAVYFLGLDRCCHRFWGQMRPYTVDIKMSDEFIEAFEEVIPRYYERVDALIGSVLESVDENSTVIICSDHGFHGPRRTKEGLQLGIQMHRELGVLAAAGPGIRKGGSPAAPSVLDITPTILALLGEPVGRDMDGFVITEMIDPARLSRAPVAYVDTYEREGAREMSNESLETPMDEKIKEELRSLGYIQ